MTAHDDFADHLGWEQTVVDDAGRGRQAGRQLAGIVDRAAVVGDHAPVGAGGSVLAQTDLADLGGDSARVELIPYGESSSGIGASIRSTSSKGRR